jgi:hypothetical protein
MTLVPQQIILHRPLVRRTDQYYRKGRIQGDRRVLKDCRSFEILRKLTKK